MKQETRSYLMQWATDLDAYVRELVEMKMILYRAAQYDNFETQAFKARFKALNELGGTGWFDWHPLDLDRLYELMETGKLPPVKKPMNEKELLSAIFGRKPSPACPNCGSPLQVVGQCLECGWKPTGPECPDCGAIVSGNHCDACGFDVSDLEIHPGMADERSILQAEMDADEKR